MLLVPRGSVCVRVFLLLTLIICLTAYSSHLCASLSTQANVVAQAVTTAIENMEVRDARPIVVSMENL